MELCLALAVLLVLGLWASASDAAVLPRETDAEPSDTPRRPFDVRLRPAGPLAAAVGPARLVVEITGSVRVPDHAQLTELRVEISDVSDGVTEPWPILVWQNGARPDPAGLAYSQPNGTLGPEWVTLPGWTAVITIDADALQFARRGPRTLALVASVVSCETGRPLALARAEGIHVSARWGYLDELDNAAMVRTLGRAVARDVASTQGPLDAAARQALAGYGRGRTEVAVPNNLPQRPGRWVQCRRGLQAWVAGRLGLGCQTWCAQLAATASVRQRRELVDLCAFLLSRAPRVRPDQMTLLSDIVDWLAIDRTHFESVLERHLPITRQERPDVAVLCGIRPGMGPDEIRRCLSVAYSKWNARVTHSDANVRRQASVMLDLLAEARAQLDLPH